MKTLRRWKYKILVEPADEAYRELFAAAIAMRCRAGVLVCSPQRDAFASGSLPTLVAAATHDEFGHPPGTIRSSRMRVVQFPLTPGVLDVLRSSVRRLFEWSPPLPTDLALFREDRDPWLETLVDHDDAWLSLTEAERASLSRWPALHAAIRARPYQPRRRRGRPG